MKYKSGICMNFVFPGLWTVYCNCSMWSHWQYCALCTVTLQWRLHFEFVTSNTQLIHELPAMELENGNIWQGPATLNIETMVWNLPIKIYPTTPLQISQGLQSQLKHKLAVWEVRKCKLMCPQQTECVQLMWNSWWMILHLVSTCLYQICLSRLWNELTWSAHYN